MWRNVLWDFHISCLKYLITSGPSCTYTQRQAKRRLNQLQCFISRLTIKISNKKKTFNSSSILHMGRVFLLFATISSCVPYLTSFFPADHNQGENAEEKGPYSPNDWPRRPLVLCLYGLMIMFILL